MGKKSIKMKKKEKEKSSRVASEASEWFDLFQMEVVDDCATSDNHSYPHKPHSHLTTKLPKFPI